ncbi:MAG: glutamine-hydrolyzing carbamoyl-phosphate synthase small subunit [Planctomycetes bacterium]|nr:glutamine-hydrolyzing carbamoyl-phosphate synthase small subunit [Planctomycetota bacterium]
MDTKKTATLALEDGTIFEGLNFGATGTAFGEIVFNTSMTGYQEILTDPSYCGQIVAMTYPLIGNYGVCPEDQESTKIHVKGFVIKELAHTHSNFRANQSLHQFLKDQNIIGLANIDTRALTRRIRVGGAMKSVISTETYDDTKLVEMARSSEGLIGRDLVREVTSSQTTSWKQGHTSAFAQPSLSVRPRGGAPAPKVVAIDCGIKHNICRNLVDRGFDVTLVPAHTSAAQILDYQPDGIFVSNGPGDPEPVGYTIEALGQLIENGVPIFGICLGLQLLCRAFGAETYKLKFGHRGANQPVKNLDTGRVEITAQNHGFAVDMDSLNKNDIRVTHINLNDNTLEGFVHKTLPVFAVQYHPEASPGPHDASYLFDAFYNMVQSRTPPDCITA